MTEEAAPESGSVQRERRTSRGRGAPTRTGVDWADPFARFARTHFLSVSGEALLALSLAGSLFFDVDPSSGRSRVMLGLLLTMAPFALVAPLVGPMIDRARGGHRWVIIATMALRCIVSVAMVPAMASGSLALFPLAFIMLVLGKTYQVSKAAAVPTVLPSDLELVEANSKLQLISGGASLVAGLPALLLLLLGPEYVAVLTALTFAVATISAATLERPSPTPADTHHGAGPGDEGGSRAVSASDLMGAVGLGSPVEGGEGPIAEGTGVLPVVASAGVSMALLRFVVGFTAFLLAFELRGGADALSMEEATARAVLRAYEPFSLEPVELPPVDGPPPTWYFGVVIAMSVAGGILGAAIAPRLRDRFNEEHMLVGACAVGMVAGVTAVVFPGLLGYALLAGGVAVAAATGKQSFDSIVQRHVVEDRRARVFAIYEARFQIVWVIGSLVPTAVHVPVVAGSVLVAVMATAAGAISFLGWDRVSAIAQSRSSRSGKSGTSGGSSSSGSD